MRFADILTVAATAPVSRDPDLAAWMAAVVTNGGTVSAARAAIVGQFISVEKAAGTWALTDDYWGLWGESAVQARTSLKQRRLATVVNTPTFTTDRDYTFNGTDNYLNTGHDPSQHSTVSTGSEQRIAVYERANVTGGISAGASSGTGALPKVDMANRSPGGFLVGGLNTNSSTTVSLTISPIDSRGLKAISRTGGGTTARGYDRGVRLTDQTGLTVVNTLVPYAVFIGAANNAGVVAGLRAASIGFVTLGAPFSDAQEAAQYANVQAWATAVGANV